MRVAGMNAMSVGIFSWAKLEPEEGQFDFRLARFHARSALRVGRLGDPRDAERLESPRGFRGNIRRRAASARMGQRERHGYRHNHCRTSADYRRLCVDMNTRLAERYGEASRADPVARLERVQRDAVLLPRLRRRRLPRVAQGALRVARRA